MRDGDERPRVAVRPLCSWGHADGAEDCDRYALERVVVERGGRRETRLLCTPHAEDVASSGFTLTVLERTDPPQARR